MGGYAWGTLYSFVPSSDDITMNADGTGAMRFVINANGTILSDTAVINKWSTSGNTVTIISTSNNPQFGTDTLTYVRQLDEPNTQRWYNDVDSVFFRISRR